MVNRHRRAFLSTRRINKQTCRILFRACKFVIAVASLVILVMVDWGGCVHVIVYRQTDNGKCGGDTDVMAVVEDGAIIIKRFYHQ